MLTQRSRYALRAMLHLATQTPGGPPVPMNRIAATANVPRKFLELILADLREAGVRTVSLYEEQRLVYGPMSLDPE